MSELESQDITLSTGWRLDAVSLSPFDVRAGRPCPQPSLLCERPAPNRSLRHKAFAVRRQGCGGSDDGLALSIVSIHEIAASSTSTGSR